MSNERPVETSASDTITVNLPELAAGKDMADEIIGKLGSLADKNVVIQAGRLVNGSEKFAHQLVTGILGAGALQLTIHGAPERFTEFASQSVLDTDLAERFFVEPTDSSE